MREFHISSEALAPSHFITQKRLPLSVSLPKTLLARIKNKCSQDEATFTQYAVSAINRVYDLDYLLVAIRDLAQINRTTSTLGYSLMLQEDDVAPLLMAAKMLKDRGYPAWSTPKILAACLLLAATDDGLIEVPTC
jgi:hypothetical protein